MTPEQKDAVCEYVDGLREAGRRYDEIEETLAGKLPEPDLANLEVWHRQWKKRQWREELKRQQTQVPLGDSDFAAEEAPAAEWEESRAGAEKEMMRYLCDQLIGHDIRGGKPRWRAEKGLSEWSASGGARNATRPFLALYLRPETPERRQWKPHGTRTLRDGQTCDYIRRAGQAGGVKWLHCAVVFRTGEHIDHVEAEARIRRRVYPGSARAAGLGITREAVQMEKLHLVREKLDHEEISARLAAVMQTFFGKASGIKSGAHLGRLTNRTRQAVSIRKLNIAGSYYEATGGKAGFEGLTSARRRRQKVSGED